MQKKKILFIGGSLNQTRMMYKISQYLVSRYECYFTPFYADGFVDTLAKKGLLESTILGSRHQRDTLSFIQKHQLSLDLRGEAHEYELVITGSDLIVQKNIRGKRLVLVQEGITEPENWLYYLVKWLKLPRYLANTSTTGLSDQYDIFCVSSFGYRDQFIRKGVHPDKIAVTGVPNFDAFEKYKENDLPYTGYVLAVTSPLRETFRYDNRIAFLKETYRLAAGRQIFFKLHPTENVKRAEKEINRFCPGAVVLTEGNVEQMIANAEVVITQQSTCTFAALALEKELHTYLDVSELRRLMPIQNHGASAERIARISQNVLQTPLPFLKEVRQGFRSRPRWEQEG